MDKFIIDDLHPWKYQTAKPFPYIYVDDFLPHYTASRVEEAFIDLKVTDKFYFYDSKFENKVATDKLELMPEPIRQLLYELNSQSFLSYLEALTGIKKLVTDHTLRGAGIHLMAKGGFLDIHADRGVAPHLDLYRRLNAIIFFNRNHKDGMGGELELWDRDMTKCVHKIAPIYNRLVVFNTNAFSYHGVPCIWRSETPRRSIATYYYTSKVLSNFEANLQSTDFKKRPEDPIDLEKDKAREERRMLRING